MKKSFLVLYKCTTYSLLLDVCIYLPPYIDTSSDIYIDIIGYAVFDSPFGEFVKKVVVHDVRITPDMWRE